MRKKIVSVIFASFLLFGNFSLVLAQTAPFSPADLSLINQVLTAVSAQLTAENISDDQLEKLKKILVDLSETVSAAVLSQTPTTLPALVPEPAKASSKLVSPTISGTSASRYANNPFGGLITEASESACDCSGHTKVELLPPLATLPQTVLYKAGDSKLYAFYQVKEGREVVGTWEQKDTCRKWMGDKCVTVGNYPLIAMVGTSGGLEDSGWSSGGSNPTPLPTDPPVSEPPKVVLPPDECKRMGDQVFAYASRGTGYYPADTLLQGGFLDRIGNPLVTLQDYLEGKSSYVAVAMDPKTFPYGTELCIPELERKYGRQIIFKVVDTGGAFINKSTTRIDICTRSKEHAYDSTINGSLTLVSKIQSSH